MPDQAKSADAFRELAEGLPQLVWTCRADGSCDYLSRQWVQYTGKPESEQLGSAWLQSVHPDDRDQLMKAWNSVVQRRDTLDTEFRIRRHDGVYRWFKTRAVPLKDDSGNVTKWVGSNTDIEDRRAAEQALRHSQAQLQSVVESLTEGLVIADLQGIMIHWNRAALEMHGFATVNEVRRHLGECADIFELADLQGQVIPFEQWPMPRVLRGEVLRDCQFRIRRKQGDWARIYSYGGIQVFDANNQPMLAMLTIVDVTDRLDAQRSLQRAKEKAEEAGRTKDHFLAMVSHELRTPLTPVLAVASRLRESPELSAADREDVEMICRNVEMEAELVNDLLSVTRLARGKIVLRQETVDAHELIRSVAAQFQPEFHSRTIHLRLSLEAPECSICADSMRLRQILGNLLSNAEKFTSTGGEVLISTSNARGRFRIQVIDNGVGIEPEMMARIFNPFEQGEQTVTRKFAGLGLGLSIARQLVELHGGTVNATSAGPNRGATFTVDLAIASTAPQAPAPPGPPVVESTPSLSILLVEDHPDTLRTMSRLLAHLGHRVQSASTVAEALSKSQNTSFDILLSDIGLPDGSGLEIVRQLRGRNAVGRAIALTGFGQAEDMQRSKDAGFSDHLVKPIDIAQLRRALQAGL